MKSAMLINQYGCFLAFAGYHAVDVPWQHSDLCQQAQEKTSDSSSKKKKKNLARIQFMRNCTERQK